MAGAEESKEKGGAAPPAGGDAGAGGSKGEAEVAAVVVPKGIEEVRFAIFLICLRKACSIFYAKVSVDEDPFGTSLRVTTGLTYYLLSGA